jgi:hypothetical protein
MNKNKYVSQIIKSCINCKYYKPHPNMEYKTLGLCMSKKYDDYINHYNYAEIASSKYGHCGEERKLFKLKDYDDDDKFHRFLH